MRKITLVIILVLTSFCAFGQDEVSLNTLFPSLGELPGGKNHWVSSMAPVNEAGACKVYSATYAYFANEAKPLFDIPRKKVYSINIRFHECDDAKLAKALYDKFAAVGDSDHKNLMNVGDEGIIYIIPDEKNPLMGDYYLSSLFKYIVMQVHADDGFVLMDMGRMMDKRLTNYIRRGQNDIGSGLTLRISRDGYDNITELIGFSGSDVTSLDLSGIVYDNANNRVQNARIQVLETGDITSTNEEGEFNFKISVGEGKSLSLFRILKLDATRPELIVQPGYYKVDIYYDSTGKTGQDYWLIDNYKGGSVSGQTKNLASGTVLSIKGVVDNKSMVIDRPCGTSFMGQCNQTFTLTDAENLEGTWKGTGGGGKWRLYKDSFDRKVQTVSMQNAGLITAAPKNNVMQISSGENRETVSINPVGNHNDFELINTYLAVSLSSAKEAKKQLVLYGIDSAGKKHTVAASPYILINSDTVSVNMDISNIYKKSSYTKYELGFPESDGDDFTAVLNPHIELLYALPSSKANNNNLYKAKFLTFAGTDRTSNIKLIKPDGKPDIELELTVNIYGENIKAIEVVSKGAQKRTWSTQGNNIYPGLAVSIDDVVENDADGSINIPLNGYENKFILSFSKGSLAESEIEGFDVYITIGEETVITSVNTE